MAEIAEKPLYRVTCGDIGINAQEVEKYLQTVMYLGKIWDCGTYLGKSITKALTDSKQCFCSMKRMCFWKRGRWPI